jgi:hypothetical protein
MVTEEEFICPGCGPGVAADEDGLCATCGAMTLTDATPWYVAALRAAERRGFERAREAGAKIAADVGTNLACRRIRALDPDAKEAPNE